jgi:hypothetical protein
MASDGTLALIANDVAATADTVARQWLGGEGVWVVHATWGGGNVTLEYKAPSGTWIPIATAATANSYSVVKVPPGQVRSVATTATAVYSYLLGARTHGT